MYKILLVEDDTVIATVVKAHLEKWGYKVYTVLDFQTVGEYFQTIQPHLVLMDISLPFFNGFYWCSEIRKVSHIPIIFISSASDNMNIVMAVNMGGDDFLAKPFDLDVMTAKVQALLRRSYCFAGQLNTIEHKGVLLNLGDTTLFYKDKKTELTKNELKIMQMLLEHVGETVDRDSIMTKLWESDSFIDDNTLTVNITRLRKKLAEIGLTDFIGTKKGIGYIVQR